ncbi:glutaredoxin domain-containing cysteine-rich protein [Ditylenchus destructor]|nr:glutaredoxin domain-containing cysteine-rich protein [Ditylenchus destructor]
MASLDMIEADLLRVKLEIERVLNLQLPDDNVALIERNGSVRGRRFHVYNTLKRMKMRNQWKKDYISEEESKIVIYSTSCSIVRPVRERCQNAVELLKTLGIRAEIRDLNIDMDLLEEISDRLGLFEEDKHLIHTSLPLLYVNGSYFGNHLTLMELNEKGYLVEMLREFQGRHKCDVCGDTGYHLCPTCRGAHFVTKTGLWLVENVCIKGM